MFLNNTDQKIQSDERCEHQISALRAIKKSHEIMLKIDIPDNFVLACFGRSNPVVQKCHRAETNAMKDNLKSNKCF